MNKILATLVLLMFMPLPSQVNAQDKTTWTVSPRFARVEAPVPSGTPPVLSTDKTVTQNTETDLHIGVWLGIEGEITAIDALITEEFRALDPGADPIPPMQFSQFTNGSPGVSTFGFDINFNQPGGTGILDDAAIQAWIIAVNTIQANPVTPSIFTEAGPTVIVAKDLFISPSGNGFAAPWTNAAQKDRFGSKMACGTALVPEAGCDIFLGTITFDLEAFPAEQVGALVLSLDSPNYLLNADDKKLAELVVNPFTPISLVACSVTTGCPITATMAVVGSGDVVEGGTADVTVTLSAPAPTGGVTFQIVASGTAADADGATPGTIYSGVPDELMIAAGATSKIISVMTLAVPGDRVGVPVLDLTLAFGTVPTGITGVGSAAISILDKELPEVTVAFVAGSYEVLEGSMTTFQIQLTLPAGGVTPEREISFALNNMPADTSMPILASDFSIIDALMASVSSVTYAADASGTALLKTFTIMRDNNDLKDPGKVLELSFGTLPAGVTAGTIATTDVALADNDSDKIILAITAPDPSEFAESGGTASITIVATLELLSIADGAGGLPEPVSVTFAYDVAGATGTATAGTDYTVPAETVISFAGGAENGETEEVTIMIDVLEDTIVENPETILISSAAVMSGTLPLAIEAATLTITDVDAAVLTPTVASGSEGGDVILTLTSDFAIGSDITVPLTFSGIADLNDHNLPATVTFTAAGDLAQPFTFTLMTDSVLESSETLIITVADSTDLGGRVTGATATATSTITDTTMLVASIEGPIKVSDAEDTEEYTVRLNGTSSAEIVATIDVTGTVIEGEAAEATISLGEAIADVVVDPEGGSTDVVLSTADLDLYNSTLDDNTHMTVIVPAGSSTASFKFFVIEDEDKDPEAFTVLLETLLTTTSLNDRLSIGANDSVLTIIASVDLEQRQRVTTATLAAIGRTISTDMLDVIEARVSANDASHLKLGSTSLSLDSVSSAFNMQDDGSYDDTQLTKMKDLLGMRTDSDGMVTFRPDSMSDLLTNSSFQLSLSDGGHGVAGTGLSLWGRSAFSNFSSTPQDVDVDGETISGQIGTDYRSGEWIAGLALNYNKGDTEYNTVDGVVGDIKTELYSLHPYLHYAPANSKLGAWVMLGYGQGDLTLVEDDGDPVETDIDMQMAAVGVKYKLLTTNGVDWALKADTFLVRFDSDEVEGELFGHKTEISASRVALSASNANDLENNARMETNVDLGLRFDESDAESGLGGEIAGGFNYSSEEWGFDLSGSGRLLVAHEAAGFEQWGASISVNFDPGTRNQGLQLSLSPVWGQASSGVDSLYEGNGAINKDLTDSTLDSDNDSPGMALKTRVAYGFTILNNNALLTPYGEMSSGSSDSGMLLGGSLEFLPSKRVSFKSDFYNAYGNDTSDQKMVFDNSLERKLGNGLATLSLFGRLESNTADDVTTGDYKVGLKLISNF